MDYFKNCLSIEEVKKTYKILAKKYHIDLNPNVNPNIMKEINIQYDIKLKEVIKQHNKNIKDKNKHIKFNDMQENNFKKVISKITILESDNIIIDIVGSWIWIYGSNTYNIKDNLKKLGFKWSRNRKKWYLAPLGNKTYSKKGYRSKYKSYNEIKNNYGVTTIEKEKTKILN